jgi:hypothetical protein
MATDPRRVEAMQNWSNLKSMNHVKGFLGMKGYYRWFIRNYGKIGKPLTDLFKRKGFTGMQRHIKRLKSLKKPRLQF